MDFTHEISRAWDLEKQSVKHNISQMNVSRIHHYIKLSLMDEMPEVFLVRFNKILNLTDPSYAGQYLKSLGEDIDFYMSKQGLKTKKDFEKVKLLEARCGNDYFEKELVELIFGKVESKKIHDIKIKDFITYKGVFPRLSNDKLKHIFQNKLSVHRGYWENQSNYWGSQSLAIEILERSNIDVLYTLIKSVFSKRYFSEYFGDKTDIAIEYAKKELEQFIEESISKDLDLDISEIFKLNINMELLFDKNFSSGDEDLDEKIKNAKEFFMKNDRQTAVEKLWDAYDNLKTINPGLSKKDSIDKILNDIKGPMTIDDLNDEAKSLTALGNKKYAIRHSEKDKILLDEESLEYLFFRLLSFMEYITSKLNKTS